VTHDRRLAASGVVVMGAPQVFSVHQFFESMDTAVTLETAHLIAQVRVDQPVERRHGSTVTQMRLVLDHHRTPVTSTHHHGAAPGHGPTEQFLYRGEVFG